MTVSRENPVALYLQIAEKLKKEIVSGEIKPGKSIGSQRELEGRFKVSKITVRKAIEVLENEDLVITSHGKGTYVKQEKVEQVLGQLQSLSDIIKKSGYNPQVKINEMKKMKMLDIRDDHLLKKNITDNEYLYIERLHIVEKNPVAVAKIYIPLELAVNFEKNELERFTIYELLENKSDITLGEAVQSIEACPASEELGELLGVSEGSPLLKAKRITYSTDDRMVEKVTFYYCYDAFAFKVNLNQSSITPMWPTHKKD